MNAEILYDPTAVDRYLDTRLSVIHRAVVETTDRIAMVVTSHSLLCDADQAERIERRYRFEADHMKNVAIELRRRSDVA